MPRRRAAPIDALTLFGRLRASEAWLAAEDDCTEMSPTQCRAPRSPFGGLASSFSGAATRELVLEPSAAEAEGRPPVLILDTRSRTVFDGGELDAVHSPGHIRGSVHIQIPTLLLRRNSRARAAGSPPSTTGETLLSYVSMPEGLHRMRQLLNSVRPPARKAPAPASPGPSSSSLEMSPGTVSAASPKEESPLSSVFSALDTVVLYEETPASATSSPGSFRLDSSEVSARVLLECLEQLPGPGSVYYVDGGFAAVRRASGAGAFLEQGAPSLPPSASSLLPMRSHSLVLSPVGHSLQLPPSAMGMGARRPPRISLPRLNTTSLAPRAASVDFGHVQQLRLSPETMEVAPTPTTSRPLFPDTAREDQCLSEFSVSTIVPGELYLGSDIRSARDVAELKMLGIKAVLNTAQEIPDGGYEGVDIRAEFERYLKIPLRDTVEATGVQQGIRTACQFIDDARLHSQPIYVHCRAGKSRSVMLVMAYLIHAHRWSLQRAYAHVLSCRSGMCPNIGFIAELMHFEERVLGGSRKAEKSARRPELRRTNSEKQRDARGVRRSSPARARPKSTSGTVPSGTTERISLAPCSPAEDTFRLLNSPIYSVGTPRCSK
ncbi:hypothetical protein MCUN1_003819 [Malassezia cuniculi]|uniref:protein-tyrosine-phosphatase n=1 Tax=Malassezia cuniculi TaxID=948313 RepID=A0AAF0J7S0_9BASI|nr:hypothetical protein MCUN1_003819 [Malassezia cuniculi]